MNSNCIEEFHKWCHERKYECSFNESWEGFSKAWELQEKRIQELEYLNKGLQSFNVAMQDLLYRETGKTINPV